MDQFRATLLDVWREACRHIDIAEAVSLITPILARPLPVTGVLVRRIDLGRLTIETVAVGATGTPQATRTERTPRELDQLLIRCRRGVVALGRAAKLADQLVGAIPGGASGDGDADLVDFAAFQNCFGLSSPASAEPSTPTPRVRLIPPTSSPSKAPLAARSRVSHHSLRLSKSPSCCIDAPEPPTV